MKGKTETCPVCDMPVEVDGNTPKSEFDNHTYAFCGVECKQKFDRNPEKYVAETSGMQKKGRTAKA